MARIHLVCARGSSIDISSTQVSVFGIITELPAQNLPFRIAFRVIAILYREDGDPQEVDLEMTITDRANPSDNFRFERISFAKSPSVTATMDVNYTISLLGQLKVRVRSQLGRVDATYVIEIVHAPPRAAPQLLTSVQPSPDESIPIAVPEKDSLEKDCPEPPQSEGDPDTNQTSAKSNLRTHFEKSLENKPLYRYLNNEYALRMLRDGELKISTLGRCRELEATDLARGDTNEGLKDEVGVIGSVEAKSGESLGPFYDKFFDIEHPRSIRNSVCEIFEDAPDLFVLCLSEFLREHMFQDFQVDACVRIDRPRDFFRILSNALDESVVEGAMGHVRYGDRFGPAGSIHSLPAVWIKEMRFAAQNEIRCIWIPRVRPISPIVVKIPDLIQFLSPARLPSEIGRH